MESGGGLLRHDRCLHAIDKLDARKDQGQQLRGVQTPDAVLRDLEQLPDHRRGRLDPCVPRARRGAQPHGGKRRLDHVGGPPMPPVLFRELEST